MAELQSYFSLKEDLAKHRFWKIKNNNTEAIINPFCPVNLYMECIKGKPCVSERFGILGRSGGRCVAHLRCGRRKCYAVVTLIGGPTRLLRAYFAAQGYILHVLHVFSLEERTRSGR